MAGGYLCKIIEAVALFHWGMSEPKRGRRCPHGGHLGISCETGHSAIDCQLLSRVRRMSNYGSGLVGGIRA